MERTNNDMTNSMPIDIEAGQADDSVVGSMGFFAVSQALDAKKVSLDIPQKEGQESTETEPASVQFPDDPRHSPNNSCNPVDFRQSMTPAAFNDKLAKRLTSKLENITCPSQAKALVEFMESQTEHNRRQKSIMGKQANLMGAQSELMHAQNRRFLIMMGGVGAMLVAFFGISLSTVYIAKDVYLDKNDGMVGADGHAVKVANSEMSIDKQDKLVSMHESEKQEEGVTGDRRLDGNNGGHFVDAEPNAIGVRAALKQRRLSSVIPMKYYEELTKISLNIGQHRVTFQVEGVDKMSTASSKCGSLVHVNTPHGRVTLDDEDIYISDDLEKHILSKGLSFHEQISAHGRRQLTAGSVDLQGFFSFFESYDWKCDSVEKPGMDAFKSYYTHKRIEVPCNTHKTSCSSEIPGLEMKPGYMKDSANPIKKIFVEEQTWYYAEVGSVTLSNYPNHPFQTLVTVKDFKTHNIARYQLLNVENGIVSHCKKSTLEQEDNLQEITNMNLDESKVFIEFLGRGVAQDSYHKEDADDEEEPLYTPIRKFKIQPRDQTHLTGKRPTSDDDTNGNYHAKKLPAAKQQIPFAIHYHDLDDGSKKPYKIFVPELEAHMSTTTYLEFEGDLSIEKFDDIWSNAIGAGSADKLKLSLGAQTACAEVFSSKNMTNGQEEKVAENTDDEDEDNDDLKPDYKNDPQQALNTSPMFLHSSIEQSVVPLIGGATQEDEEDILVYRHLLNKVREQLEEEVAENPLEADIKDTAGDAAYLALTEASAHETERPALTEEQQLAADLATLERLENASKTFLQEYGAYWHFIVYDKDYRKYIEAMENSDPGLPKTSVDEDKKAYDAATEEAKIDERRLFAEDEAVLDAEDKELEAMDGPNDDDLSESHLSEDDIDGINQLIDGGHTINYGLLRKTSRKGVFGRLERRRQLKLRRDLAMVGRRQLKSGNGLFEHRVLPICGPRDDPFFDSVYEMLKAQLDEELQKLLTDAEKAAADAKAVAGEVQAMGDALTEAQKLRKQRLEDYKNGKISAAEATGKPGFKRSNAQSFEDDAPAAEPETGSPLTIKACPTALEVTLVTLVPIVDTVILFQWGITGTVRANWTNPRMPDVYGQVKLTGSRDYEIVKDNPVFYVGCSLELWASLTGWTEYHILANKGPWDSCETSNDCIHGDRFCRVGDKRCMTDGECEWGAKLDNKPDRNCSRMPRLGAQTGDAKCTKVNIGANKSQIGYDCWAGCGYKQGSCDNFCGAGNMCCRKGWTGNGCKDNGTSASFHSCVTPKPLPVELPVEPVRKESGEVCQPYSKEACRAAAEAAGLELGSAGWPFASSDTSYQPGCVTYHQGADHGRAYYGDWGSTEDKKRSDNLYNHAYRVGGHDCRAPKGRALAEEEDLDEEDELELPTRRSLSGSCVPHSEAACRAAAIKLGFRLGRSDAPFKSSDKSYHSGCVTYTIGRDYRIAYYGDHGSIAEKSAPTWLRNNAVRFAGADCVGVVANDGPDHSQNFLGCYKAEDHGQQRPLDEYKGDGKTFDECAALCKGYKYFSRRQHGQCFCENNWARVSQYGFAYGPECNGCKKNSRRDTTYWERNCVYGDGSASSGYAHEKTVSLPADSPYVRCKAVNANSKFQFVVDKDRHTVTAVRTDNGGGGEWTEDLTAECCSGDVGKKHLDNSQKYSVAIPAEAEAGGKASCSVSLFGWNICSAHAMLKGSLKVHDTLEMVRPTNKGIEVTARVEVEICISINLILWIEICANAHITYNTKSKTGSVLATIKGKMGFWKWWWGFEIGFSATFRRRRALAMAAGGLDGVFNADHSDFHVRRYLNADGKYISHKQHPRHVGGQQQKMLLLGQVAN